MYQFLCINIVRPLRKNDVSENEDFDCSYINSHGVRSFCFTHGNFLHHKLIFYPFFSYFLQAKKYAIRYTIRSIPIYGEYFFIVIVCCTH
ncbi:hypothetical protein ABFX02_07G074250 [Erythranthe guttata]